MPWFPGRRLVVPIVVAAAVLLGAVPARAAEAPEVAIRQIVVGWKGLKGSGVARSKEEALALAQAIRAEAVKPGADFAVLARGRSEDRVAGPQGGFVGFLVDDGIVDPAFLKILGSLAVGEISQPIDGADGWRVVLRIAPAEAHAILAASSGAFIAARFPDATCVDAVKDRTKEAALADARKAAEALRTGQRFEDVAPALRAVPFRKQGWLARVMRRGTALPEYRPLEDALFATAIGSVSDPVDTPIGWVVLRRVPWFRAHVEHLLVSHVLALNVPPAVRRSREQARARAADAMARLKVDPGAWGKLVAETSDDVLTSPRGGSLGPVEPGMLLPELEAAIAGLAPGSIGGVVESRLGFHVLRRLD